MYHVVWQTEQNSTLVIYQHIITAYIPVKYQHATLLVNWCCHVRHTAATEIRLNSGIKKSVAQQLWTNAWQIARLTYKKPNLSLSFILYYFCIMHSNKTATEPLRGGLSTVNQDTKLTGQKVEEANHSHPPAFTPKQSQHVKLLWKRTIKWCLSRDKLILFLN